MGGEVQAGWEQDVLGEGYTRATIDLGVDPDGEGNIVATLVRYVAPGTTQQPPITAQPGSTAVLYVHGYTDYFFQKHVAEHFAARGDHFFALDLRKCGRSRMEGHTAHFVSDLELYDVELNDALRIIRGLTLNADVIVVGHSTGGLIVPLWLDRLRRNKRDSGVIGVVLNSPWFDLQGPAYLRSLATIVGLRAAGELRGKTTIVPTKKVDAYGSSLHASAKGEWEYDLAWKPLSGFPIRAGWLYAIRRGHNALHKGLDIGVPALILRSKLTKFMHEYGPDIDVVDAVLDVKQIQRWAGCLGDRTSIVPIENARHDVFLSAPDVRDRAFEELDLWLDWLERFRESPSSRPQRNL